MLLDYQFPRGWIKINDNQTATWNNVNNNQNVVWGPIITQAFQIVQWENNSLQPVTWTNIYGYTNLWTGAYIPQPNWQQVNNYQ